MSSPLGRIDVCCDAPPYLVVKACRHIGMRSPEDVRWLRMSAFRKEQNDSHQRPSLLFWTKLWKASKPRGTMCTCGEALPELELVVFRHDTGDRSCYLLGQCCRCHTVFWDEP